MSTPYYYIKTYFVNFFKTFYLISKKMFSMGVCFYYFSKYNIILIVTSTFSIRLCIRQNLSVASFFICSAPFRSGEPALHGSTSFYALPKMSRNKKRQQRKLLSFGSPSWTRTNDPAVNSRMLYRLSYRGLKIRRRPALPGRVRPSTIGAERLNFCVRYGYRWFPFAFVTEIVEYAFSSHRTFTTAYVLSP